MQKGQEITIKNYCQELNGRKGTIKSINGEYIYVEVVIGKKKRLVELYRCEIEE